MLVEKISLSEEATRCNIIHLLDMYKQFKQNIGVIRRIWMEVDAVADESRAPREVGGGGAEGKACLLWLAFSTAICRTSAVANFDPIA